MENSHFLVLFIFLNCFSYYVSSAGWKLVWHDEFHNGENLADKWNFETGCTGNGNNELQCYTDNRPENARIEHGKLIIQARKERWQDKQFTSARLLSKGNWLYGKFEIRARMPKGKHLWPAIWMMPVQSSYGIWPASGEIDIAEYRGQRPHQIQGNLHYGPAWNNKGQVGTGDRDYPNNDFSNEWHTFGIDWSSNAMKWELDGQVIHSEPLNKNLWNGFYTKETQPFDKPFYLILNLAVGGNFFPESTFGSFSPEDANSWSKNTLEIDFVRVYSWEG